MGGVGEWLLAGLVAIVFGFIILRPDLWGNRDRHRSDGGTSGGFGLDGSRQRDDDSDSDGGDGDGGGGGD